MKITKTKASVAIASAAIVLAAVIGSGEQSSSSSAHSKTSASKTTTSTTAAETTSKVTAVKTSAKAAPTKTTAASKPSATKSMSSASASDPNAKAIAAYIKDYNGSAPNGLTADTADERRELTTDGETFCIAFYETGDVNQAKRYIVSNGVDSTLAGFVEVAATHSGSLCPLQ